VAEKRVPTRLELIQGVIGRFGDVQSPRVHKGELLLMLRIRELPAYLEHGLRVSGGEIFNGVTIEGIERSGDDIASVRYNVRDGKPRRVACSHLLSTIPVNDLITMLPDLPAETKQAARGLS
jgi:hypothetical protein